jgi:MYXO-CTERM domain-containing protein
MPPPPPEKGAPPPGDWTVAPEQGSGSGDAWISERPDDDQGCSCTTGAPTAPNGLWLLALLALALRPRRR